MSTHPSDQEPDSSGPDDPKRNRSRYRTLLIALPIAVVIAFVAILAVGPLKSSSSSSGGNATTASSMTASPTSTEGCTTGPVSSNVRVTIYGNGEAACAGYNQEASKTTEDFWRTKPQEEELQGELVCSMSKSGSPLIEVRDTGEHLYGNRICASLTARGWHEAEGPGAKVEQEQNQRKAEREQAITAAREAKEEQEDQKRQKGQEQLEGEEAVQRQKEAREHQKEDREREQEDAKQHEEEEKQQQEVASEDHRNEEETRQDEREAQRGE